MVSATFRSSSTCKPDRIINRTFVCSKDPHETFTKLLISNRIAGSRCLLARLRTVRPQPGSPTAAGEFPRPSLARLPPSPPLPGNGPTQLGPAVAAGPVPPSPWPTGGGPGHAQCSAGSALFRAAAGSHFQVGKFLNFCSYIGHSGLSAALPGWD